MLRKKNTITIALCLHLFHAIGINSLNIIQKPSANFNERKEHKTEMIVKPEYIILHFTANCSTHETLKVFWDIVRPVSSHYIISTNGKIVQMVDESKRAWHAGKSQWLDNWQMNTYSIGIEITNPGYTEINKKPCTDNKKIWNKTIGQCVTGSPNLWYNFTPQQIEAVIKLCRDIMKRYNIPRSHVLGHSDIAPGRKLDPGPLFPWKILASHGIGLWPKDLTTLQNDSIFTGSITDLQKKLQQYGYHISITGKLDTQTKNVIQAFQMHFRPNNIDGNPDNEIMHILENLLKHIS
jgi:N-acetylmuramoyl-L-alanine amidase